MSWSHIEAAETKPPTQADFLTFVWVMFCLYWQYCVLCFGIGPDTREILAITFPSNNRWPLNLHHHRRHDIRNSDILRIIRFLENYWRSLEAFTVAPVCNMRSKSRKIEKWKNLKNHEHDAPGTTPQANGIYNPCCVADNNWALGCMICCSQAGALHTCGSAQVGAQWYQERPAWLG